MTDDTKICSEYSDDLAELALGVLTGRDRARVLSHVESCPRCADELEQLARVADTVVQVAPEVEPPLGFDVRLFEQMGVRDDLRHRRGEGAADGAGEARRSRLPRWVPAVLTAAAAVVALGISLGVGLSSTSGPAPTRQAHHAANGGVMTAALVAQGGRQVGRVAIGGAKPWMSMTLADANVQGAVSCVVITHDGVHHWVGTFVAREGYGAWIAPLHVKPSDIRSAEVVSPSGTVIATATLG
jgi:hypothetical protein